jgi:trehalose 6-phosphate phosphatase
MNPTLNPLDRVTSDPANTGIFCDFDGTLSAIVPRAADATPVGGAADVMSRLAEVYRTVAVISGRSLEDLRSRFSPDGVLLAGSYGRERSDRGPIKPSRDWPAIVTAANAGVSGGDGVTVEPIGHAAALQFRLAPDRAADVGRIAAALAREYSLEVRPGRMVVELTEPGPGKAEALRDLVAEFELSAFLFGGDDVSDGEAFEWARSTQERCVLIGVRSDESPETLERFADIVVDGPHEFVALLDGLASSPGR